MEANKDFDMLPVPNYHHDMSDELPFEWESSIGRSPRHTCGILNL